MEQITTFGRSAYSIGCIHLFDGITDPVVAALLAQSAVIRLRKDETISPLRNNEACVYAVLSGAIGNTLIDETQGVRTEKILPGESIGELSVLDDIAHSSTLVALQETELLVIESHTLWRLIDEADGVARNLLRQLSFRLRAANAQLRKREKVGEFYRQLSMVDGLTSLHNRAWLNDKLSLA